MIKCSNMGKSVFSTIKSTGDLPYGAFSKWPLNCDTLVQWTLVRLFPGSRLLERETKWRKTKATRAGGGEQKAESPHFTTLKDSVPEE